MANNDALMLLQQDHLAVGKTCSTRLVSLLEPTDYLKYDPQAAGGGKNLLYIREFVLESCKIPKIYHVGSEMSVFNVDVIQQLSWGF